jgi:sortase A
MRRIALLLTVLACVLPASAATAAAPSSLASIATLAKPASIGTLSIPRLKVTAHIYVGVTDTQFNLGVGEWPGSPLPGTTGNIVIGGHRTSGHRPFANINKLKIGDEIQITRGAQTFKYVVSKSMVVSKTAMWITKPTPTATLTLFSCHPVGKTSHRFVIRAAYVPT